MSQTPDFELRSRVRTSQRRRLAYTSNSEAAEKNRQIVELLNVLLAAVYTTDAPLADHVFQRDGGKSVGLRASA
jgi:hypothetical protein